MPNNKDIVSTYYNRILNEHKVDLFEALFDEEFKSYLSNGTSINKAQYKGAMMYMLETIPDVKVTIDDQIEEKDTVATRWTAIGTPKADFGAIKAVGRKIRVTAMNFHRIKESKIIEHWEAINIHAIEIL